MWSYGFELPAGDEGRHLRGPALASRWTHVLSGSAAIALVLALTGCAAQRLPESDDHGDASNTATSASSSAAPSGAAGVSPNSSTATGDPRDAEAETDAASRRAATVVAARAVAEFCQPGQSPQVWLAGIRRDLTDDAAAAFATVLPSRVPCTRTTGTPVTGIGDGSAQVVLVSTDAGRCTVTLQRTDSRSRWRVSRIALPVRH